MITDVILPNGDKISAEEAVRLRDSAKAQDEPISFYIDPKTGDTIIKPRKGHKTRLSKVRAHFYHPSEINEIGLGIEKTKALDSLESMLESTGEFSEIKKGLLEFSDIEQVVKYDARKLDWDYGFSILWAKKNNGKEYALLVLNRVPNSNAYFNMLNALGNRDRFEGQPKIKKQLVSKDGSKTKLGDTIYLATIQLKNEHLFRPNQEEGHSENSIMLGDWQTQHLSSIYPEFVYFDPNNKTIDVVNLKTFPHSCLYSNYRYDFKKRQVPEQGSEFCQKAESKFQEIKEFTLEPLEIKKDSLKSKIGNHSRLYLAKILPQTQTTLF